MDKAETNGFLRAVEAQLRAVEDALIEIDRIGDLNDEAYTVFRAVKADLINVSQAFKDVRGWNSSNAPNPGRGGRGSQMNGPGQRGGKVFDTNRIITNGW